MEPSWTVRKECFCIFDLFKHFWSDELLWLIITERCGQIQVFSAFIVVEMEGLAQCRRILLARGRRRYRSLLDILLLFHFCFSTIPFLWIPTCMLFSLVIYSISLLMHQDHLAYRSYRQWCGCSTVLMLTTTMLLFFAFIWQYWLRLVLRSYCKCFSTISSCCKCTSLQCKGWCI